MNTHHYDSLLRSDSLSLSLSLSRVGHTVWLGVAEMRSLLIHLRPDSDVQNVLRYFFVAVREL